MPLSRYRYIVVEGPIGVGKTSLARRLASRLSAGLMLERPEQNPFLPRFYQDMARWALPTQLFFLFQRVNQLRELAQLDLFKGVTVGDFLLEKDPLFARMTLSADEMHLYQQIYDTQRPQTPVPDLVIYLQAQPGVLHERVRQRGNDYERPVSEEYLAVLADSYSRFFYNYNASPVLIVNSERLNFVKQDQDLDLLIERLRGMRGGREFFNFGD
jgi:deoxyguanosine kinase